MRKRILKNGDTPVVEILFKNDGIFFRVLHPEGKNPVYVNLEAGFQVNIDGKIIKRDPYVKDSFIEEYGIHLLEDGYHIINLPKADWDSWYCLKIENEFYFKDNNSVVKIRGGHSDIPEYTELVINGISFGEGEIMPKHAPVLKGTDAKYLLGDGEIIFVNKRENKSVCVKDRFIFAIEGTQDGSAEKITFIGITDGSLAAHLSKIRRTNDLYIFYGYTEEELL